MSILSNVANNIQFENKPNFNKEDRTVSLATVADVILDESHPEVRKLQGVVEKDTAVVGAILVKRSSNWKTRDEQFQVAYPLDRNIINLPVKNEIVEIIQSPTGRAYYRVCTTVVNPSETANKTNLKEVRGYYDNYGGPQAKTTASKYGNVASTGISKTKGADSPYNDENYGKYYEADNKLHRLKLYEGDFLIESRFGQSIRFSGYDNKPQKMYPSITIRNRENSLSKKQKKKGQITVEDINRDGSILIMSSGKKELPFQPGTVNESNKSNFVTKPKSFPDYPKVLDEDQVLINSGRIILSSKTKEMIMWSKGNTGLISDGHWSWDLAKGITGDIGGNWHVTTNNFDFRVFAGHKGRCILGSGPNLQNIPRGNDLNQWLGELIDLIITNIYYIASGTTPPQTMPGPTNNIPKYLALKARLPRLLSRLNFTGNDPSVSRVGKDQAPPGDDSPLEESQEFLGFVKTTGKVPSLGTIVEAAPSVQNNTEALKLIDTPTVPLNDIKESVIYPKVGGTKPPMPKDFQCKGYENAKIPVKDLVGVEKGGKSRYTYNGTGGWFLLHPQAAQAYLSMKAAAKKDGISWTLTSAYRDLEHQQSLGSGSTVAKAGSSPHGLALAIDFGELYRVVDGSGDPGINRKGRNSSQLYRWLSVNGPKFGWYNPIRLADGAGVDEMWHFEYHVPIKTDLKC